MPLRDDVLTPIPGDNPSGKYLKYDPVYDKIKEARREDDDAPQGDWQWTRKTADWTAVLKLAGDALATKSKDLQLGVWVTEALLRKEGFGGLKAGLDLLKGLVENFWDTVYPEMEDGDLELRAAPLEWMGSKFDDPLKKVPLCRAGYGYFKYRRSSDMGYEEEVYSSTPRREAREIAIQEGKLTPEDFDKSLSETSKEYYEQCVALLAGCQESLEGLTTLCEEKFADFNPSFSSLRSALEEVHHTAKQLFQKKRELLGEKDEPTAPAEPAWGDPEAGAAYYSSATASGGAAAATARAPARPVVGLEPADMDDATARLAAIAKFMRQQNGYNPAPYLMLRGFRWGELRAGGATPDQMLLEAPSSEVRQELKKAMLNYDWVNVIEQAETAMAQPCGRGWLDLQRYIVTALETYGYPLIALAIRSELKALLKDMPDLRKMTLMDDTPTANVETQAWIDQMMPADEPAAAAPVSVQEVVYAPPPMQSHEHAMPEGEPAPPDAYQLATDAVRGGRIREAIEILATDAKQQDSGRGRFQRRMQLAELCMKAGEMGVAQPILEELQSVIDQHNLENWEAADVVAYPLTMLMRCLVKSDGDAALRQKLYGRICRLDPVQALACKP